MFLKVYFFEAGVLCVAVAVYEVLSTSLGCFGISPFVERTAGTVFALFLFSFQTLRWLAH
jgi:hypothetical protein